jgi:hypothetical protein
MTLVHGVIIIAALVVLALAMALLIRSVRAQAAAESEVSELDREIIDLRVEAELFRRTAEAFAVRGLPWEPVAPPQAPPAPPEPTAIESSEVYRHMLSRLVAEADSWTSLTEQDELQSQVAFASAMAMNHQVSADFLQAWRRLENRRRPEVAGAPGNRFWPVSA